MRFSIVAIAAAVIGAVMADQAYPTVPTGDTKWNAGKNYTVTWNLITTEKVALTVDLFKGNASSQTLVNKFGSAKAGATSFQISLPKTLPADWYSIRVGDSWSHYFMIRSTTGATPTGAMPTPVSTATASSSSLPTVGPATVSAIGAKAAPTAANTPNSAAYLSAAPMAMAAAAVAAAAMAF
ncbi:hypothetical protein BC939DRAFT_443688 [Gamsiella multidivaricata]|uniref:uncharacterized protein n=1 Tax=Gamsiella multidivaricata TaxID=101098 RepID=UPI0022206569|nr:uncharacterized protein BC939DRAFT_443688 [Gamsiella multidivaricata]KAG0370576.1 hypothetical protein BGZ54_005644 [Gamsiella multidivaricata]KAI7828138.1 hypothetical protein BC939DRAFT_443688 [Gamsiella multidivaricata]